MAVTNLEASATLVTAHILIPLISYLYFDFIMLTIFYIIETILVYSYSSGLSLNARPYKRQRFNHHRVEIKVAVLLYCIVEFALHQNESTYTGEARMVSLMDPF